jgi:hypothetical protein
MHEGHDRLEFLHVGRNRHRAVCTCGGWQHDRDVDLRDERERLSAEAAFEEHQLQSVRG